MLRKCQGYFDPSLQLISEIVPLELSQLPPTRILTLYFLQLLIPRLTRRSTLILVINNKDVHLLLRVVPYPIMVAYLNQICLSYNRTLIKGEAYDTSILHRMAWYIAVYR